MDVESELDRLFGVPLDEFTATRDEIAKSLADAGSPDAQHIRKLKKPVVSAWTVNQLSRKHRDTIERLVAAGEAIETAEDPGELRTATADRKRTIAELLKTARGVLEDAGHNPSSGTLDRISNTLLAGTTSEARRALLQGRLGEDLSPSGLEAWGLSVVPEPGDPDDQQAHERAEQLAEAADGAEREARDAQRALDEARAALERAERDAEKTMERARAARDRADQALEDL
jgi:hypothetical protein